MLTIEGEEEENAELLCSDDDWMLTTESNSPAEGKVENCESRDAVPAGSGPAANADRETETPKTARIERNMERTWEARVSSAREGRSSQ